MKLQTGDIVFYVDSSSLKILPAKVEEIKEEIVDTVIFPNRKVTTAIYLEDKIGQFDRDEIYTIDDLVETLACSKFIKGEPKQ